MKDLIVDYIPFEVTPEQINESISQNGGKLIVHGVLQRANAKLDPTWKPEMIAGGFAGHCVNNREQRWIITENPDGEITEGYLGNDNQWYEKGSNRRTIIGQGWVKFYDYNY